MKRRSLSFASAQTPIVLAASSPMNGSARIALSLPAWGKWQGEGRFHRLEHHCADVAACFEAILEDPVSRRRFAVAAGQEPLHPTTLARLTVLAFLHDFAKINSGFQFKVRNPNDYPGRPPPRMSHVKEAFLCMGQDEICHALGFHENRELGRRGCQCVADRLALSPRSSGPGAGALRNGAERNMGTVRGLLSTRRGQVAGTVRSSVVSRGVWSRSGLAGQAGATALVCGYCRACGQHRVE